MRPTVCFRSFLPICCLMLGNAIAMPAQPRGNPEATNYVEFQPWGVLKPPTMTCNSVAITQQFGRAIIPVGDVNHDGLADYVVERLRCDTSFAHPLGGSDYPEETLLYYGVRNGVAKPESGQRIGPTEINTKTHCLCSGDWDGDGHIDIACSIQVIGDTSDGDKNANYDLIKLVIFWGQSDGRFIVADTTQLVSKYGVWMETRTAMSHDLDNDACPDLLVQSDGTFKNGVFQKTPNFYIYKGSKRKRWGHNGIPNTPDWQWWYPPNFNDLKIIDQDCDGNFDLVLLLQRYGAGDPDSVAVLYGSPNRLPDTTNFQAVSLTPINGAYANFADVTGDGVPELLVNCASLEVIRVFAGKQGQRIADQFGTGNDPPDIPNGRPYARPWAEVWLPHRIHDGWFTAGQSQIHDVGDINLDGLSDICTYSYPFFIWYCTGSHLDSLIDAEWYSAKEQQLVSVGDVDGSGVRSIATLNYGDVQFFKPSKGVPNLGNARYLPHPANERCGNAVGVEERQAESVGQSALAVEALPNPGQGEIIIHWQTVPTGIKSITIWITDASGKEIRRIILPSGTSDYRWNTRGLPKGMYFVSITAGSLIGNTSVIVQ